MTDPVPSGFEPPPYPYDRLREIAALAGSAPGGAVDLSVGTPCDPPPAVAVAALAASGAERGYPSSVGSPAFREAAARYLSRRFSLSIDPAHVGACVGTKELVASTASYLRLRSPDRDSVIGPALAYPTYAMGATLAGCRYVGLPTGVEGGVDLGAVSPADASRALLVWVNSPANPNGATGDLSVAAKWGATHGVPVFSDECYAEYAWHRQPQSILQHADSAVVAVHSISKRSNLAGLRAGFFAGDPELVGYLASVRTHAGLMVPGPVQAAAAAALDDDTHVEEQRARYRRRLERAVEAFAAAGLAAEMPHGGFYLWVAAPAWAASAGDAEGRDGAWVLAEALARAAGLVVSPGEFYGEAGAGFVRVAMVVPDDRLFAALDRLQSAGDLQAVLEAQAVAGGGKPGR